MDAFMAITSTCHQKQKYPVEKGVGEVRGDQPSSQKCYAETVQVDSKRDRRGEA